MLSPMSGWLLSSVTGTCGSASCSAEVKLRASAFSPSSDFHGLLNCWLEKVPEVVETLSSLVRGRMSAGAGGVVLCGLGCGECTSGN